MSQFLVYNEKRFLNLLNYSPMKLLGVQISLKNSLIIREENTKEITAVSVVLYVIKNHVNLQKL